MVMMISHETPNSLPLEIFAMAPTPMIGAPPGEHLSCAAECQLSRQRNDEGNQGTVGDQYTLERAGQQHDGHGCQHC